MFEHTDIDLAYLEQIGFLHDLGILARTPIAMLGGRKGH
jgi:lipopolysaccharide/colanic/teichoic acid biosynthesis glycosyltransferase